jgi:predicted phosphodiesterase
VKFYRILIANFVLGLGLLLAAQGQDLLKANIPDFVVKPYLQLGNKPALAKRESVEVLWQSLDRDSIWTVQKKDNQGNWQDLGTAKMRQAPLATQFSSTIQDLAPGAEFSYRVLKNGQAVFEQVGKSRQALNQPYRFAVFGDCGKGSIPQKLVAGLLYQNMPDFVVLTGDIVYEHGRMKEYFERYFPIYNAPQVSSEHGAPLICSRIFMAAPGNHDIGTTGMRSVRRLNKYPDGLAYFQAFSQPLNGPISTIDADNTPKLEGDRMLKDTFIQASGDRYPVMANYSFDWGNSHWLILDGNDYMNWTDKNLRNWVAQDLANANGATWRFVAFHQPGFSSSHAHFNEQRMRLLSDLFEKGSVDVVFCGHAHDYQRTYPLCFKVKKQPNGQLMQEDGRVDGAIALDKDYKDTGKPKGIIYIVTGAGGAPLGLETKMQPFTVKFNNSVHSFTSCQVNNQTLSVKQISQTGAILDSFVIVKK